MDYVAIIKVVQVLAKTEIGITQASPGAVPENGAESIARSVLAQ